jgi:hypothetical protein
VLTPEVASKPLRKIVCDGVSPPVTLVFQTATPGTYTVVAIEKVDGARVARATQTTTINP